MQFKFEDDDDVSGNLAFTPPTPTPTSSDRPLLVVTDAGHDAVHLVDVPVVGQTHAGYLASPGSIAGPRGVAASGTSPLVAVIAWKEASSGDHVVVVYRGSGAVWEAVRVIGGGFGSPGACDGQLDAPFGLRFSAGGSEMCVADAFNNRISLFRVDAGGFVRHVATDLSKPHDVEEVEGGWLVACCASDTVEFVGDGITDDGFGCLHLDEQYCFPAALAVVPSLGLVVREVGKGGRLQVFATPDAIAMASMSPTRVSWMCAMARAALRREAGSATHAGRAARAKRIHLAVGHDEDKGGSG
jgi:hypothetical protein